MVAERLVRRASEVLGFRCQVSGKTRIRTEGSYTPFCGERDF